MAAEGLILKLERSNIFPEAASRDDSISQIEGGSVEAISGPIDSNVRNATAFSPGVQFDGNNDSNRGFDSAIKVGGLDSDEFKENKLPEHAANSSKLRGRNKDGKFSSQTGLDDP